MGRNRPAAGRRQQLHQADGSVLRDGALVVTALPAHHGQNEAPSIPGWAAAWVVLLSAEGSTESAYPADRTT